MYLLIGDVLQSKPLMEDAKVWTLTGVGERSLLLFGVLEETLCQDANVEPSDGFAYGYRPVVDCVCGFALIEDGRDHEDFPGLKA